MLLFDILWECPFMMMWTNYMSASKNRKNSCREQLIFPHFLSLTLCTSHTWWFVCEWCSLFGVLSYVVAMVVYLSYYCFPLTYHSSVNSLFQDKLLAVWVEAGSGLFYPPKWSGHLTPSFYSSWIDQLQKMPAVSLTVGPWKWLFPQGSALHLLSEYFVVFNKEL